MHAIPPLHVITHAQTSHGAPGLLTELVLPLVLAHTNFAMALEALVSEQCGTRRISQGCMQRMLNMVVQNPTCGPQLQIQFGKVFVDSGVPHVPPSWQLLSCWGWAVLPKWLLGHVLVAVSCQQARGVERPSEILQI